MTGFDLDIGVCLQKEEDHERVLQIEKVLTENREYFHNEGSDETCRNINTTFDTDEEREAFIKAYEFLWDYHETRTYED